MLYNNEIILKGRKIVKGYAEGKAIVSKDPISFLGGVDPKTGIVVEKNHELEGKSIARKILVFPYGKGSTVGSYVILSLANRNLNPKAIINVESEPIIIAGCALANIPLVDRLEKNPVEVIKNEDYVIVDGIKGLVRIKKFMRKTMPKVKNKNDENILK
jgi:predicted aconitase with swiveling domain